MTDYNFCVVPSEVIGIPETDNAFPLVFRFLSGEYKDWFVVLEDCDKNGKFSFYVAKVPKNVDDRVVKKYSKKLKKIMKTIVSEIISQFGEEENND